MSNYFQGVTFNDQNVTPADDAVLHRAILPDGILTGCEFKYSGATLTMGAGNLLICGRQLRHVAEQGWAVTDATSGYARLILTVDLSKTATEDTFEQVDESIEYAASIAGFADLEKADINAAGIRYQVEVCIVRLGSGGIVGFVQSLPALNAADIFAPGGFGPGQDAAKAVKTLAELDALTKSGVYGLMLPLSESYVAGVDIRMSTVSVEAYDPSTTLQTLSVIGTTTRLQRWRTTGTWGPWSVQNPPMALGAEYRTAEQWNGSPVYVKRLAFVASGFSSQTIAFPHGVENMGICMKAEALWKRTDIEPNGWRNLPSSEYSTGEWDGQIEYVNAESIKFRLGSELRYRIAKSTEPVYVTLHYTKA